jgi:hypothetical protein
MVAFWDAMMIKVVTIFVIFIMVLGIFGKLRLPKMKYPIKRSKVKPAVKCGGCGRYNLAGEACACGKG